MNKTKLVFVRHGQSIGNAQHVLLGHTNLDLSELGYRQAEIAARAFLNEKVDAIYASDLKRAYNTALAHAKLRGMTVIPDEGFREIYLGAWEGASTAEFRENKNPLFEDFCYRFGYFAPPNGEGVWELSERIFAAAKRVADENPGKTLLIGTHAAAIRMFFAKILGYGSEEVSNYLPFPTNASFSVCEYDGERFVPIEFSRDEHIIDELSIQSSHIIFGKGELLKCNERSFW